MMPAGSQPLVSAREQFRLDEGHAEVAATALDQEQPLVALYELREAMKQLDAMQVYAVALARAEGKTWAEIAAALDLTRQGAQQRFS